MVRVSSARSPTPRPAASSERPSTRTSRIDAPVLGQPHPRRAGSASRRLGALVVMDSSSSSFGMRCPASAQALGGGAPAAALRGRRRVVIALRLSESRQPRTGTPAARRRRRRRNRTNRSARGRTHCEAMVLVRSGPAWSSPTPSAETPLRQLLRHQCCASATKGRQSKLFRDRHPGRQAPGSRSEVTIPLLDRLVDVARPAARLSSRSRRSPGEQAPPPPHAHRPARWPATRPRSVPPHPRCGHEGSRCRPGPRAAPSPAPDSRRRGFFFFVVFSLAASPEQNAERACLPASRR